MALARRTEGEALAGDGSGSSGAVSRDSGYGWLTTGTGLKASRGAMKSVRTGTGIGSQRGSLLGKSARDKVGRIKGVKRL